MATAALLIGYSPWKVLSRPARKVFFFKSTSLAKEELVEQIYTAQSHRTLARALEIRERMRSPAPRVEARALPPGQSRIA